MENLKNYKELYNINESNESIDFDTMRKALDMLGFHSTGFGGIWTNGVCKIQVTNKSGEIYIKNVD